MTTEERLAALEWTSRRRNARTPVLWAAIVLSMAAGTCWVWIGHSDGAGSALAQAPAAAEDENEPNRVALVRLAKKIGKVELEGTEFKGFTDWLSQVTDVNIQVKWNLLKKAGIDQLSEIKGVNLKGVSATKAIEVVLDDIGSQCPLGFVLNEGVVTISTKEDLLGRGVSSEVRANRFVLVDEKGKERAALTIENGVALLRLDNENGKPRLILSAENNQASLLLRDRENNTRARLEIRDDEPSFRLSDANGNSIKSFP
jgi:hypothetical protein